MKYILYVSCVNCRKQTTVQSLQRHYNTCTTTSSCAECNSIYQGKNKFCGMSCSAKYNNRLRSKESREKQRTTLRRTITEQNKTKIKTPKVKTPKIKTRTCLQCGRIDTIIGNGRFYKDVCKFCDDSTTYRDYCRFEFDLRDYPDKFDLELLAKHGMFHPVKNKNGVSRDHKLSIAEGKRLGVDPEIMKHPANCQLLLQSDNMKKSSNSSITLEELLHLIANWEDR